MEWKSIALRLTSDGMSLVIYFYVFLYDSFAFIFHTLVCVIRRVARVALCCFSCVDSCAYTRYLHVKPKLNQRAKDARLKRKRGAAYDDDDEDEDEDEEVRAVH